MSFLASALTELARNNRLFVGICAPDAQLTNYDLETKSYAFVKVVPGDIAEALTAAAWEPGIHWKVARRGVNPVESVVVNSTLQVFSCLYAPVVPSVDEPAVVSGPEVTTTDGYAWRYLFTVPAALAEKFQWPQRVPMRPFQPPYISTFESDGLPAMPLTPKVTLVPPRASVLPYAIQDVSGVVKAVMLPPNQLFYKGRQYACVEDSAASGSGAVLSTTITDGQIGIAVLNGGSGYVDARITIKGDGQGAVFTPNIADGAIVGFTVVSPGSGYTEASAFVTAGTNSGVVEAIYPDFAADFDVTAALIGKSIPAIDMAGSTDLSAHLFISAESCADSRIRGTLGSLSVGAPKTVAMEYASSLGINGTYSLRQNMQINTLVQTG